MTYRKTFISVVAGLLLVVLGTYLDKTSHKTSSDLAVEIESNLNSALESIDLQADNIRSAEPGAWGSATNSFFLVNSLEVLKWNKTDFLPDLRVVQDDFSTKMLARPRGTFLLRKWKVDSSTFLLAVLPLHNRFKINNRYLVSGWNEEIFPIQDINVTDVGSDGYRYSWKGNAIFNFQLLDNSLEGHQFYWIAYLGIFFIVVGIFYFVYNLHRRGLYEASLMILFSALIGGRIIVLYILPSPDVPLFDPAYFASSSYNRSVGDLFINSICVLIPMIYLFYNYYRIKAIRVIFSWSKRAQRVASLVCFLLCFFTVLYPFLFIETIFHNSAIPLDITRTIGFDAIRIVSYLSIVIGCVTAYTLVHIFSRIVVGLTHESDTEYFIQLFLAAILFMIFSYLIQRDYWITCLATSAYLVLIKLLHLNKYLYRISYSSFLYLFVAIIVFSIQSAFSIKRFVIEDKISSQFRFANSFLTDRDYLGEYLLGESVERISADPFIQTRLGSPFLSKATVRQKVKQVYLNSYFDKYEVQIHLFNSSGKSYDNSTANGFTEVITDFQQKAIKTNYEGVYFLKNASAESAKQYLVVIPISRFNMVTGYVVLDLSLKRVIPKNVFPELLLDDRFIQYFKNKDISYAFYHEEKANGSFGKFNYERNFSSAWLFQQPLFTSGLFQKGYIHIGMEDEAGNVTVVSSPTFSFFGVLTNFSFLFTIGLCLILISLIAYGAITLYQKKELNYSARIQLYVYVAFILPVFLVSLTSLGLIGRSAENQLKDEYLEKSRQLGERLTPLIDTLLTNPNAGSGDIDNPLIELSRLANVDASVFLTSGKLLASSQPLIYEDRILSPLMDRVAFEAIVEDKAQSFINNEKIGSLNYNSTYFALKSPDSGELLAVLSLPFFESAYSLERTQINVVANIMNIFCAVFIVFLALSFFAVRWLTFPLQLITRTLRSTTLTGSNKHLVWNSKDEIGMMVSEYNRMLDNLDQSKIDLSRVQKESAWREIAKQVAHEVKNPLTPMKLTLQQMEQAMISDGLSKQKIKKSVQTLLQQVEILNDIASSFSAFARMPAPILQKIELSSLLKQVINLHSDYKEGKIELTLPQQPIHILGDRQLLSRVFSNILLNALQSGLEGEEITIKVDAQIANEKCIIRFSDNGRGIDPELREKVFMPHFSTKKSGSGLGLAIAKQGIEQNGGTINFETSQNKGTTFFIEFPLAV